MLLISANIDSTVVDVTSGGFVTASVTDSKVRSKIQKNTTLNIYMLNEIVK